MAAMARQHAVSPVVPPTHCFAKELSGENPPSFQAMQRLYELATELFALRPWEMLEDDQLILTRDGDQGDFRYCFVMGALGEVYAMHAYMGSESYRYYRRIQAGEQIQSGEFLAALHSVYVEFVPRSELERQDRDLLVWLEHPRAKGIANPIFRASRRGFHPWFVTAEEAGILTECVRATIVVCHAVRRGEGKRFWSRENVFPMVLPEDCAGSQQRIELAKAPMPDEQPLPPARVDKAKLSRVRGQDLPLRGVMELDYIPTGAPIGRSNERKACACFSLAVDAGTGLVYAPHTSDSSETAGDSLAQVFVDAVQATHVLPKEVRLRSARLRNCVASLIESMGTTVSISPKLPALDEAREHLLAFMRGGSDEA